MYAYILIQKDTGSAIIHALHSMGEDRRKSYRRCRLLQLPSAMTYNSQYFILIIVINITHSHGRASVL